MRTAVKVGVLGLAGIAVGVGIGALIWSGGDSTSKPGGVLLVQAADGGRIESLSANRYRLVLSFREARINAFTDRPERRTLTFASNTIPSRWSSAGFDADPPNAALLVEPGTKTRPRRGASRTFVFELTRPRAHAGELSFEARLLRAPGPIPTRFGEAALFIDGADPSVERSNAVESAASSNATVPLPRPGLRAVKAIKAEVARIRDAQPPGARPVLQRIDSAAGQIIDLCDDTTGGCVDLATMFQLQFPMHEVMQEWTTVATALQPVNDDILTLSKVMSQMAREIEATSSGSR
ncbi:MAG: hypothetical protein WD649_00365 [Thermoleophilaceae bacterium]